MAERRVDIAIFGATAGGSMAAIAAADTGQRMLLIEPGWPVGGMVSGGLGWTDRGEVDVIGGLARQFCEQVWVCYGVEPWGDLDEVSGTDHAALRAARERRASKIRVDAERCWSGVRPR